MKTEVLQQSKKDNNIIKKTIMEFNKSDLQNTRISITNNSNSPATINLFDGTNLFNANNIWTNPSNSVYSYDSRSGMKINLAYSATRGKSYTISSDGTKLVSYDSLGNEEVLINPINTPVVDMCLCFNDRYICLTFGGNSIAFYDLDTGSSSILNTGGQSTYVAYSYTLNQLYVGRLLSGNWDIRTLTSPTTISQTSGALGSTIVSFMSVFDNSNSYVYFIIGSNIISGYDPVINSFFIPSSTSGSIPVTSTTGRFKYNSATQKITYPDDTTLITLGLNYIGVDPSIITGLSGARFIAIDTVNGNYYVNDSSGNGKFTYISSANFASNVITETITVSIPVAIQFLAYYTSNGYLLTGSQATTTIYYISRVNALTFSDGTFYNYLTQNIRIYPIRVFSMDIMCNTQAQFDNIMNFASVDASGEELDRPKYPSLSISAYQDQDIITNLKLGDVILDGNTYIKNYIISPNTTVSLILYYIQVDINAFNGNNVGLLIKHPLQKRMILTTDKM